MDKNTRSFVEGRLYCRGIDIDDIVNHFRKLKRFGFHDVVHLLLFGSMPDSSGLDEFDGLMGSKRELPKGFTENMVLSSPSPDIMNNLARSVLALYSYDSNPDDISVENVVRQCLELISRFPIMAAYGYHAKRHYYDGESLYIHRPMNHLNTAENFLRLIRPAGRFMPLEAEALDLCLVLHAGHDNGDNSDFAVKILSSSNTDTYSVISAVVGSLKGLKHVGCAEVKVVEMVEDIKNTVLDLSNDSEIEDYLSRILNWDAFNDAGLICGMEYSYSGAAIIKRIAEELAVSKGRLEEYRLFESVERGANRAVENMKNGKSAIADISFYSGLIYSLLDIPKELFMPISAISSIVGWSAHRIEKLVGLGRIIRPAYRGLLSSRLRGGINEENALSEDASVLVSAD